MAITDELREWKGNIQTYLSPEVVLQLRCELNAIADRIDAEHERMLRSLTIDAEPMTDESMAEHGWIRLPLDADGEPIHIGDVMDVGIVFAIGDDGVFMVENGFSGKYDVECFDGFACHHHAPTVEDVLREFALACEDAGNAGPEVERIAAEYAAKLRLAEGVDG